MAPRREAKRAAEQVITMMATADSDKSPPKRKKPTAKTITKKSQQVKTGTRRAKAVDKHENEVTDNEAAGPAKKLRSTAKKVVMSPKTPEKTVKNNTKVRSRKINKQEVKTDAEDNNASEKLGLQITERKTRTKTTTALKKAGTKKSPADSKTIVSATTRSEKKTTENGNDKELSKNTRYRKAIEENVAPAATRSKTSQKRKNEDTKNIKHEQILEKQEIQVDKKSRRANKKETKASDVGKFFLLFSVITETSKYLVNLTRTRARASCIYGVNIDI